MFGRVLQWLRGAPGHRNLDLSESLQSALDTLALRFTEQGIGHALIGGVAVSAHGPPRATLDLDLLVDSGAADEAHQIMLDLGFETLQKTDIFANYLLRTLRVDFLYTQGSYTKEMLKRAQSVMIRRGSTRLVIPEDLIGLKLQALANNPARYQDRADIEGLIRHFHEKMDMTLVREYFRLFNKEDDLDAVLEAIRAGR